MTSIDVVVTTFNRPEPLRRCLEALQLQTQSPARIIVVDDCSEPPITVQTGVRPGDAPVTVIRREANAGPARGRNEGVEASSADVVLFVDDDVVAAPDLVERHARAHEAASHPVAIIGPLAAPPDWDASPWCRWEADKLAAEYLRMIRQDYAPTWRQFFTGNASVRRDVFVAAGGFDERFTRAEDIELAYRLQLEGCGFVFEPQAVGWHYASRSLRSWLKIPRSYALFDRQIHEKHPSLGWDTVVRREQGGRHQLTRLAVLAASALRAEHPVALGLATTAGRLGSFRWQLPTGPMMSLAFALEYSAGVRVNRPTERRRPFARESKDTG